MFLMLAFDNTSKKLGGGGLNVSICNIKQKTSAYCEIIYEYYNLNPKDPMHIMRTLQLQSHYTCDLLFDVGIA
jgi:hypothetical protein